MKCLPREVEAVQAKVEAEAEVEVADLSDAESLVSIISLQSIGVLGTRFRAPQVHEAVSVEAAGRPLPFAAESGKKAFYKV